jgi:acyl-homoserine-lactone acylase
MIMLYRVLRVTASVLAISGTLLGARSEIGRDAPTDSPVIRRDAYGVPHILAKTETAAAFAHGYAVAEDHLPALARLFLRAQGRQAEVFGEAFVREDLLVHRLGIHTVAEQHIGELPPLMRGILEEYAAGYNLYLSEHRDRAPAWAEPVSGVDVLAHCRAVLLLDFALDKRPFLQQRPPATPIGSNMWAIGRGRSQSGRGILLANPHLAWEERAQLLHEVHLTVPDRINVAGVTLIGFPVVTIGFNEYLGWAHTVNSLDSDDVYELKLSGADHYLYDGDALPLRKRPITYRVKTDAGVVTRTEVVESSHHGPLIRRDQDRAWAYKSANLDLVNFLTQYNLMAKARSLAEFRGALQMQQLPMFNVGYADREGNVFFLFNGRIPLRPAGFNWAGTVPGDTSVTDWQVLHPLADLPQLVNPAGGYVQNSNDPPWYTTLQAIIDRKPFPPYLVRGDTIGWRGQVSLSMLEADPDITLDEVMARKFDEHLLLADRLKPPLLELAAQPAAQPVLAEAVTVLTAWDNQVHADSLGAELFLRWWSAYLKTTPRPFKEPWNVQHPIETPTGLSDPAHALTALEQVATAMKQERGRLAVAWGDIHRLRRGAIDLPLGGADITFRSIGYRSDGKGAMEAVSGDSYVLAVEFREPPVAYSVMVYSESSDPRSSHYTDQSVLFSKERLKSLWFTEPDIAAHLERSYAVAHPTRPTSPAR